MGSNSNKKAAIQRLQKQQQQTEPYKAAARQFSDTIAKLRDELRLARIQGSQFESELRTVRKMLADDSRTLKHERRLREEVQRGAIAAKESLAQIRSMHQPISSNRSVCRECGHRWPCHTLRSIREPEEQVIASLLTLQHELQDSGNS